MVQLSITFGSCEEAVGCFEVNRLELVTQKRLSAGLTAVSLH